MHCPYCRTENDDEYSFCVSCGKEMLATLRTPQEFIPPTQAFSPGIQNTPSVDTAYPPNPSFQNPYQSSSRETAVEERSRRGALIAALVIIAILAAAAGAGAIYYWSKTAETSKKTALPDHLGFFLQTRDGSSVTEIKMRDTANALEERDKLIAEETLPGWENGANFVLFADAKEVPLTELKLVKIDSITNEGSIEQFEYQAVPIDREPNMKTLRVPAGFSDGTYAFALFNGDLNEGNHKFWAFKVKNSPLSGSPDSIRKLSVSVKNSPTPEENTAAKPAQPKKEQSAAAPAGSTVAFCTGNDVVLRSTPNLEGKKIGKLSKGQRLYVISYSDNYDEWRGNVANWAYIQTETGTRGWVFTPFVSN